MDVEGMEGKALQGMIGLLKKHQPKLIIEVHKSRGVDLSALAPVLREAGYSTAGCLIGKSASPDADASYEFLVDPACEPAFASPIRAETSVASYVGK